MAAMNELNNTHSEFPLEPDREPSAGLSSVLRALDLLELALRQAADRRHRAGRQKRHAQELGITCYGDTGLTGYARQNPTTGRYALGLHLAELGTASLAQVDLRQQARPFVEQLCRASGETVHLAEMIDDSIVYIDKAESEHVLTMRSRVGSSVPLHCTGLGKALCAFLPQDFALRCLDRTGMVGYRPNTIATGTNSSCALRRSANAAMPSMRNMKRVYGAWLCLSWTTSGAPSRRSACRGPLCGYTRTSGGDGAAVTSVGRAISAAMGLRG